MPLSPKALADKLTTIASAWEQLAPDTSFAKMTLAQFKTAIKPSFDDRGTIADLEKEMATALNKRDDHDVTSLDAADKVVKSVVGDPDFGDDSSLYEAMGYIRASERKSGLTRKGSPPAAKP